MIAAIDGNIDEQLPRTPRALHRSPSICADLRCLHCFCWQHLSDVRVPGLYHMFGFAVCCQGISWLIFLKVSRWCQTYFDKLTRAGKESKTQAHMKDTYCMDQLSKQAAIIENGPWAALIPSVTLLCSYAYKPCTAISCKWLMDDTTIKSLFLVSLISM